MKRLGKLLSRTPFLKNVAILASGTAVAQVLTVLAYPILMRLFDPADYGLFALFGSITLTVVVAASGRYELAAVLEKDEAGATNVLVLALTSVLAVSALAGLVLLGVGPALMRWFDAEAMIPLLPLLPLSIFVFASYNVLSYWATRRKAFKRLSVSQVSRSFGVAVAQIALGLVRATPGSLVIGQILGQTFAVAVLAAQIIQRDWRRFVRQTSWAEMRRLARIHRDFPLYNVPRALINSTTVTAPAILLTVCFGPAVAGLYWFAYRLLEMPYTLIGDATRRVFYQRAVELANSNRSLSELYVRTSGMLALIALGPALALILGGPWLFDLAFGTDWREAGEYVRWIVAWWLVKFAALPSIMLIPVLRLQRMFLAIEAVTLVPKLAVIPLAALYADALTAVAGYALVGLAYHLTSVLVILHYVRRNDARLRHAAAVPA